MLRRCEDENCGNYDDYGGRGIKVCAAWHDFGTWLRDVGYRPTSNHQIDRRDNDGDYTPDNCHWVTDPEQRRNKRSNVKLTHNGETLTIADWSARAGINRTTLYARVRQGLSATEILMTPPDATKSGNGSTTPPAFTHLGITLTLAGWAKRLGVAKRTLHMRLRRGWTVERALTP